MRKTGTGLLRVRGEGYSEVIVVGCWIRGRRALRGVDVGMVCGMSFGSSYDACGSEVLSLERGYGMS